MPTPFSLKMLLDVAQHRSDAVARALGRLNTLEQEAHQKLSLLLGYRHDYQIRFQEYAKNGIDQTEWRNFRAFMVKLDAAIAEQRKAVASSRSNMQAGRIDWQAEQRKLKSFDTLTQRNQRVQSLRAARLEQREQDEQAIKSLVHNKTPAEHD